MKRFAPIVVLAIAALPVSALTVYTENFEAGTAPGFSGAGTVQSTGGLSAFGFGNLHLKNDGSSATILTLNGLAAHNTINVTFDLAVWDSVDLGSDFIQVAVDGIFGVNETFGNYGTGGPGTLLTPTGGPGFSDPQYGYGFNRDSARRVTFQLAHTSSTAVLTFQYPGSQLAPDEAFGIDNVLIETDAVASGIPEPSTVVLCLTGLAACIYRRRRS